MLILLGAFAVLPLLVPWLVGRIGARAFYLAALLPVAAFIQAAIQTPFVVSGGVRFETYTWIPALGIDLSMRMDTLGWVMALIVTGVGALVMLYCRWYFRGKTEGVGQFAAVLLAFAGAMYGLVLTDDIVVLVMFWEVTSVLSYLLIGYYHRRGASRRAALQALLVTTLGGLVMLIGVVLLVVETGTSSLSTILAEAPSGPVVDAALVLILVGALSKSAIFPFHFWLPGAMAAPTPVSAYLHAAAMVKAGIYLIARLAPVFAIAPPWRPIVVSLGVFTMLLGGWQALRETDLKRILAFGTVSQLGFLAVMLGFGTRDAALAGLALLIGHALFKSSLFLVVGVIDRQLSTRDIRELSGLARQAPVMATFSVIAVASMVGIIPTIGFVAKESALTALLYEAAHGSAWGIVAFAGVVLGFGPHGRVRRAIPLGCLRGRRRMPRARACPTPTGPTRRSASSERRSSSSGLTVVAGLGGSPARHGARALCRHRSALHPRRRAHRSTPPISPCGTGSSRRCGSRSRRSPSASSSSRSPVA